MTTTTASTTKRPETPGAFFGNYILDSRNGLW